MFLIDIQQEHIDGILAATPYSQRNGMRGCTLLNRKVMTLRSLRRKYREAVAKIGMDEKQATITMQDAEDMAVLEHNSE